MRKALALLVSVALTGIIGVSAAQAHRGPDRPAGRPQCTSDHSHGHGHGHHKGRGRGHHHCAPPTDDDTSTTEEVTTTTESATTTRVTFEE